MHDQSTLKRHAGLVDRMAGTLGLDLEERMLNGSLSFGELEDAVLRCTECSSPGACETWLDAQQVHVTDAPAYCRNTELFQRLGDL